MFLGGRGNLIFARVSQVMDQRVFVSFNPFNVYVTQARHQHAPPPPHPYVATCTCRGAHEYLCFFQADTKPGCVLRPSTVTPILADRGLLDKREIETCKNNMNTWAFVGDLNDRPQIS